MYVKQCPVSKEIKVKFWYPAYGNAYSRTPESCMEVVGSGCDPFVAEITYLHLDGIILGIGRIVAP